MDKILYYGREFYWETFWNSNIVNNFATVCSFKMLRENLLYNIKNLVLVFNPLNPRHLNLNIPGP